MLDQFTKEDKLKYRHLEKLEARNKFDITEIKTKLEQKYKADWLSIISSMNGQKIKPVFNKNGMLSHE